MPVKVKLTIVQGEFQGREYVFDERGSCLIGRATDCKVWLPDRRKPPRISRHHCLLDIDPPAVRVQDLGSRNGTRVNGQVIGKRQAELPDGPGARPDHPGLALKDGDEIRVGETVLRVGILTPSVCPTCGEELPEGAGARPPEGALCPKCVMSTRSFLPADPPPHACAQCGGPILQAPGETEDGEALCTLCSTDPWSIVRRLLRAAAGGDERLKAVRDYTVGAKLGQGGMGAVFLLRHRTADDAMALKLMLPRTTVLPEVRERFRREVLNCRSLSHPNVVQLRDSGYYRGVFFFTMEYCAGGNVRQLVKGRGGPLPIDEAAEILLPALDGLEYAHNTEVPHVPLADGDPDRGRGLVHRDIKPDNLLLCKADRPRIAKLADFGLAKSFGLSGLYDVTVTGSVLGAPQFTPRQQVIDFKRVERDVDVWAMAATLYYMLTTSCPRDFPPEVEKWMVVLEEDPVPIRRRNPEIPARLAELIDYALTEEPAIPFQTAADFRKALVEVL